MTTLYPTPPPFSPIVLSSDGYVLTGLHFVQQGEAVDEQVGSLPIFKDVTKWLDDYFAGKRPNYIPEYQINNATPFRREVLEILKTIPYGETITYGEIAVQIAKNHNIDKMSAQAVGGAVGWNPIGIIIPCHRVLGIGKKLTGYSGGIDNKIGLLNIEGIQFAN
ncbi:MAG: methylated-DNA--[protein]-cysteine S-methyltransferase [Bacteroidales bacterium]|nr:methylated-DNA--[protein]-cysteine S-methyltransferase [Bacteroidales bacterium]